LLPDVTLVVSPLISLMQDQVGALRARGVAAAYLSSTQRPETQAAVREAVRAGRVRLLYLAPERWDSVPELLAGRAVSLLAVDEAHCISEWGEDFRPRYRQLGRLRSAVGGPPTIALTATATPATREDIIRVLGLSRPVMVMTSFDRPNLFFSVRRLDTEPDRFARLVALLRPVRPGTAIVYAPTKNRTDGVATALRWRGFAAAPYHAGLPGPARRALLRGFQDGDIAVMVATTAFGMGIDKADVRLVVHLGVPSRPESYYQEAGRAGRDGQAARCELLWREHDFDLAARFARSQRPHARASCRGDIEAARRGLDTMRRYVASRRCRRAVLLEYLGEKILRCAGCDRCG
jgi:ATP-dependent DNA helicase RecQ